MNSLSWADDVAQPAAQLRSLLADRGGFFSSNPQLVGGCLGEARVQLLAVVLLEVADSNCSRWVLLQMAADAPMPGRWRFPGTTFAPGEMPLLAARRAVTEHIELLDGGVALSLAGLEHRVMGVGMDWLPELGSNAGRTCEVDWNSTLVFTYHARITVPDVRRIESRTVAPQHAGQAKLAGIVDMQSCVLDGTLGPVSEKLWNGYWDPTRSDGARLV